MRIVISIEEVQSPLSSTKYLSETLSETLYFYPESA